MALTGSSNRATNCLSDPVERQIVNVPKNDHRALVTRQHHHRLPKLLVARWVGGDGIEPTDPDRAHVMLVTAALGPLGHNLARLATMLRATRQVHVSGASQTETRSHFA